MCAVRLIRVITLVLDFYIIFIRLFTYLFCRITKCKELFWKHPNENSMCEVTKPIKRPTSFKNSNPRPAACEEHWFTSVRQRRMSFSLSSVQADDSSGSKRQDMEHSSGSLYPSRLRFKIFGREYPLHLLSSRTHLHRPELSAVVFTSTAAAHCACVTNPCFAEVQPR